MRGVKEHLLRFGLAGIICVGTAWLADREPPVTYVKVEVATEIGGKPEPVPAPGRKLPIHFVFNRDRACDTFADRRLLDSGRAVHDLINEEITPIETGQNIDVFKYVPLPAEVHAGPATLSITVRWRCNLLHYLWPIRQQIKVPVLIAPAG